MAIQTIATTVDIGYSDGPGGKTSGVGCAVAGAYYLMEVETDQIASATKP